MHGFSGIGDIYYLQAGGPTNHIGVAAGDGHAAGETTSVKRADAYRRRSIGDIYYLKTSVMIGYVSVAPGDRYIFDHVWQSDLAELDRIIRLRDIEDNQRWP
ncbi:hypothetical protein ES703_50847 [subsurface metagenome]